MSRLVVLDAGHGGRDSGAVSGHNRMEKDDNLRLSLAVGRHLINAGVTVLQTRPDDRTITLDQRVQIANDADADLFLSLHRNSYTTAAAKGVELWIHTNAGLQEAAVAGAVLERIANIGIQSNRGVKKGNFQVLRESRMPALLVELGFLTNGEDNRLFDSRLDAYAAAIATGVTDALGGVEEEKPPKSGLYRVQVRAFRSRDNAERFLKTVKEMGLDAFLVEQETA